MKRLTVKLAPGSYDVNSFTGGCRLLLLSNNHHSVGHQAVVVSLTV